MDLSSIPDEILLGKIDALAETERFSMVDLLFHLGELDQRSACQRKGYASVFAYLTRHLGYSESDAIRRVRTARAARRFPSILRMLASGDLHLVGVSMLEPLLTSENHERLLRIASRKSKREIERIVARLSPAVPEPRDSIRLISASASQNYPDQGPVFDGFSPSPLRPITGPPPVFPPMADAAAPPVLPATPDADARPGSHGQPAPAFAAAPATESAAAPAAESAAASAAAPFTAPESRACPRAVITFTAGEDFLAWLKTARDLLRHRFPEGRMEDVIGEALRSLVRRTIPASSPTRPRKKQTKPRVGATSENPTFMAEPESASGIPNPARATPEPGHSRPRSRRIPKRVRDEVWRRDGGRCAFVGPEGVRCGETGWLEWDHIVPWALGGRSDDPANIRLLCRAHNRYEAERVFGNPAPGLPGPS